MREKIQNNLKSFQIYTYFYISEHSASFSPQGSRKLRRPLRSRRGGGGNGFNGPAIRFFCGFPKLDFVMVFFFVNLKCNSNSSFLKNPYFHTFNWHLQVLLCKKKFRSSVLFRSFSWIPGLILNLRGVWRGGGGGKND